jgi:hypothetical protein
MLKCICCPCWCRSGFQARLFLSLSCRVLSQPRCAGRLHGFCLLAIESTQGHLCINPCSMSRYFILAAMLIGRCCKADGRDVRCSNTLFSVRCLKGRLLYTTFRELTLLPYLDGGAFREFAFLPKRRVYLLLFRQRAVPNIVIL